jgi:hypothetical protein
MMEEVGELELGDGLPEGKSVSLEMGALAALI